MNITSELRLWADEFTILDNLETLTAIADRIDAEHEKECSRAWMRGHDVWASVGNEKVMAERGWVRLPMDADGEVWHPNDMMEAWGAIECMMLYPDGDWYLRGHDTSAPCLCANECRHQKKPATEDLLREFAEKIIDSQIPDVRPTYDEAIAEYAAKFRLVEE